MMRMAFARRFFAVMVLFLPLWAGAVSDPQSVVKGVTDTLLGDLQANRATYKSNPAAFYNALDRILGPAVDADGIARSVMTVKYSRNASPEQIARFEENFKRSLMQFYGNALLEYENNGIRVLPSSDGQSGNRASVAMEITGSNNVIYPVSFTMVQMGGEWKVRNVIVNGINVGRLFRDQFASAMQENGNDLNRVIDNWVNYVARTKDTKEMQQAGVH